MTTVYADLSEEEKELDRAEADRILEILGFSLLRAENEQLRKALDEIAETAGARNYPGDRLWCIYEMAQKASTQVSAPQCQPTEQSSGFTGWRRVRWGIYNLAFRILGKTKVWPRLGQFLW
jgi:hypothetical protein